MFPEDEELGLHPCFRPLGKVFPNLEPDGTKEKNSLDPPEDAQSLPNARSETVGVQTYAEGVHPEPGESDDCSQNNGASVNA